MSKTKLGGTCGILQLRKKHFIYHIQIHHSLFKHINHLLSKVQPLINHSLTTHQPPFNHLSPIIQPPINYRSTTYHPSFNHPSLTIQPPITHYSTLFLLFNFHLPPLNTHHETPFLAVLDQDALVRGVCADADQPRHVIILQVPHLGRVLMY